MGNSQQRHARKRKPQTRILARVEWQLIMQFCSSADQILSFARTSRDAYAAASDRFAWICLPPVQFDSTQPKLFTLLPASLLKHADIDLRWIIAASPRRIRGEINRQQALIASQLHDQPEPTDKELERLRSIPRLTVLDAHERQAVTLTQIGDLLATPYLMRSLRVLIVRDQADFSLKGQAQDQYVYLMRFVGFHRGSQLQRIETQCDHHSGMTLERMAPGAEEWHLTLTAQPTHSIRWILACTGLPSIAQLTLQRSEDSAFWPRIPEGGWAKVRPPSCRLLITRHVPNCGVLSVMRAEWAAMTNPPMVREEWVEGEPEAEV